MAARYCAESDLIVGDVTLPAGSADLYVNVAADEMDAEIGFTYILPINLASLPEHVKLVLKNCNRLIASGRLLLGQAAGTEDSAVHAYGQSLLREGQAILKGICSGQIDLIGAPRVEVAVSGNAPRIIQKDKTSAVDAFYGDTGSSSDIWRPG